MGLSAETSLIITLLKQCHEQNQMALLTDIFEISKKRHHLTRALTMVKRDYGYCFSNEINVGYIPVRNDDKVKVIQENRHNRIKNQIDYWEEEWQTIDTRTFTPQQFKDYLFGSIKLTAHQFVASTEHNTKIEDVVKKYDGQSMVKYDKQAIAAMIDIS